MPNKLRLFLMWMMLVGFPQSGSQHSDYKDKFYC